MIRKWNLSGEWSGEIQGMETFPVQLPGTLDTNRIGKRDKKDLRTRFTRKYTYEGLVNYKKKMKLPIMSTDTEDKEKRLFMKIERSRELELFLNGERIEPYYEGSLSTPYVYELTEHEGENVEICLAVDNYYNKFPRNSIIDSSAATDETQTNWNGILGEFCLYTERKQFFSNIKIYPRWEKQTETYKLNICIEIDEGAVDTLLSDRFLELTCEALETKYINSLDKCEKVIRKREKNRMECWVRDLTCKKDVLKWDEGEGNLYCLKVRLLEAQKNRKRPVELCKEEKRFGVRVFGKDEEQRLTMNGRRFFLRGEANCCVFPETGYPPLKKAAWKKILEIYASYGVNCMRFHSWCPPEAAFEAADEIGMMMQPELSQWNYKDAFGNAKGRTYYWHELSSILENLANHPSFVMLTFGNELQNTSDGDLFVKGMLAYARECDPTRLYAKSSNYHYGELGVDEESDFYTSMAYGKEMLRATSSPMIGHLNQEYPSAKHNYQRTAEQIIRMGKPVFGFEVGQYEVLPDFSELGRFHGVTAPVNLKLIREDARKVGLEKRWDSFVEATGELALLCYKEEVEAVLRTKAMSGLSLLGLQDFPGQGTALVGMLNSHLQKKSFDFARPDRFHSFFNEVVPLFYLEKYTFEAKETIYADLVVANYGKKDLEAEVGFEIWDKETGEKIKEIDLGTCHILQGKLEKIKTVSLSCWELLSDCKDKQSLQARQLYVKVYVGEYQNEYPLWIYNTKKQQLDSQVIFRSLSEEMWERLEKGENVFLEPVPEKENFVNSIGGQFTTDFWSVGTFPEQEGRMGLVIDLNHPIFSTFPTEKYCNYQWWAMTKGRAMILPENCEAVVTVPDCYIRMRHMGILVEASVGKGRIMISSMGLLEKQRYPECRALLRSILEYMEGSDLVEQVQHFTKREVKMLINEK